MLFSQDFVVTSVSSPFVVRSKKGDNLEMTGRHAYGISLCLNGQITYAAKGKQYISTKNNAVILPKGGFYTLSRDTDGLFPLVNFECDHCDFNEITVIPLRNPQACMRRFEHLQQLFFRGAPRLKILSAFYDFLATVSEENTAVSEEIPTLPPLVRAAMEFMEENIHEPGLSNLMVADHLNISEIYLRKLFRTYCHTTPRQYLLTRRIRLARHMLVHTSWNVTAIAQKCGFSSLYPFCRTFKQHTGLTPTQYASQNSIQKI